MTSQYGRCGALCTVEVVKQMVLESDVECCTGLAAGFDKDAEAVEGLLDLGFGFVEIGEILLCVSSMRRDTTYDVPLLLML